MWTELQYLALTIFGEARSETELGMKAVGSVVINRTKSKKYPKTIKEVVLQPNQFHVWRPTNPNYKVMMSVVNCTDNTLNCRKYKQSVKIAYELLEGGPIVPYTSFSYKIKGSSYGNHRFS